MDKSLDEIISARPRNVRRGSSRRGAGVARRDILGNGPVPPRARYAGPAPVSAPTQPADKIIVSNLPLDVNEAQIKELFHSTVGPLREVTVTYDAAGRSKGIAQVHFIRKGDATKAYNQYNNRLIDGKRPMRIEIIVDPARPATQNLAARMAPPPAPMGGVRSGRPAGRGRGRGGGRRRDDRPVKSAADLDAEMEDYSQANNAAPAPAAAT